MGRFLLVTLFICIEIQAILGAQSTFLCKEDLFKFRDEYSNEIKVNSFIKLPLNFTLKKVGYYLLNDDLDFTRWFSDSDAQALTKLKQSYQNAIQKIYNENMVNNKHEFQLIKSWKQVIIEIKSKFENFKDRKMKGNGKEVIEKVGEVCDRGIELVDLLILFKNNVLSTSILARETFQQMMTNQSLLELKTDEKLVFEESPLSIYYEKPLIKLIKFKFRRASKIFYDFRSYAEIDYAIYIPISKETHDEKKPCTKKIELPLFFLLRGRA